MPRGSNRAAGAPALPGAGRPATRAIIHAGDTLALSQVYPDGNERLGGGVVSIRQRGRDRLITIAQNDGSEIRILVIHRAVAE